MQSRVAVIETKINVLLVKHFQIEQLEGKNCLPMYLKIAVELTIDIVKVKKTLVDLKAKLQLLRTVKNERMEMSDTENSNMETLVFPEFEESELVFKLAVPLALVFVNLSKYILHQLMVRKVVIYYRILKDELFVKLKFH